VEKYAGKSVCAAVLSTFKQVRHIQTKYALSMSNAHEVDCAIDGIEREILSINRIYRQCLELSRMSYSEEQRAGFTTAIAELRVTTEKSMWQKMEGLMRIPPPADDALTDFCIRCEKATNTMKTMLEHLDKARRELMPRS